MPPDENILNFKFNLSAEDKKYSEPMWQAEHISVLAGYFDHLDHELAKKYFYIAYEKFREAKINQRASIAYQNYIANISRIEPKRRLIYEYRKAYLFAIESKSFETAGMVLNNLSREYQLAGASNNALKFANEAVRMLEEHAYGSIHYYLAVAHRCELNALSGFINQSVIDFEEVFLSIHEPVVALVPTLRRILSKNGVKTDTTHSVKQISLAATETWREREHQINQPACIEGLTSLENKLVQALFDSPKNKYALIEFIYGKNTNISSAENRLRQLLFKIRKKKPTLITEYEDKYYIGDRA